MLMSTTKDSTVNTGKTAENTPALRACVLVADKFEVTGIQALE